MITLATLLWIAIIFFSILIVLMLLKPTFLLKRDPLTGRPLDELDGTRLFGWTVLFTAIAVLIYVAYKGCTWKGVDTIKTPAFFDSASRYEL